ncbi:MAG TPA: hypothetical protein VMV10_01195 [Pirellulales bacterium]|nr:hypothetical protein [Pirellulales bacterium]
MSDFDPYRKWLSIPEEFRPPTHYQLLGISADERDLEVIDAAVLRQSAYVRNFQTGKYGADAARILNEIAAAKLCILDPAKRAAYDADLKRKGQYPQPAHETPVAPLAPEPQPRTARPVAQAARPQPVAPSIDLDALAGQARVSARGRSHGPRVRLTSRPKQTAIPPAMWLIPLGIVGLLVVAILVMSLAKKTDSGAEGQPSEVAEGGNAALPDEGAGSSPERGGPTATSASAAPNEVFVPGGVAPGAFPGSDRPGGASMAGASRFQPATAAGGLPVAAPSDLVESEADSGAPSVFPGEMDGGEPTVSIPLPPSDPLIVFAAPPSSLVAVGQTVYDAKTGAVAGKTGAYQAIARDALRALSSDGKYYAAAKETGASGIEVRSCETGEFLFTLNLDRSFLKLKLLAFGEPGQLVSAASFGRDHRVQIWDLSDGTLIKEFSIAEFDRRQAALSDNASSLAVATPDEGIVVYDLRHSRNQQPGEQLVQIPILPGAGGAATVDGLCFSPAGDELLAVVDGGARILCWNERGELVFEHVSGVDMRAVWTGACVYQGPAIEWRPQGRGWLLGGHFFFDRALRRVTWMLQTERDEEARMRFLDADRLLLLRGRGHERKLADIALPWEKIDTALRVIDSDQPRYLGPGESVSVQVRVGRVLPGTTEEDVRTAIEYIVGKRLEAERISMAPKRPTQLVVNYFEEQKRGTGAGKSPTNQCDLKLELIINGKRDVFTANVIADAEGEGAKMREYLYWRLANRLRQTPLPYFIPKSVQLTSLPAIIRP